MVAVHGTCCICFYTPQEYFLAMEICSSLRGNLISTSKFSMRKMVGYRFEGNGGLKSKETRVTSVIVWENDIVLCLQKQLCVPLTTVHIAQRYGLLYVQ